MFDIEWPFETHMDFIGQKMAERLFQVIIVAFGIVGFISGYILQQYSITIYIVLTGLAVSALLTLPPWPMYRNHPVQWQKPDLVTTTRDKEYSSKSGSSKPPKKETRKKTKKDE
ncbi:unnamed protein product [Didymodactylos carnosus]|uniref:Signal peptidase complex subunit 1 n=1 Tax=Didymodactylos carnosus TaxID=1234261 RepID=A0A814C6S6_9BILA|nr:unnamed protein product [Didymodactylos carnosus]CAF0981111.1 unnamed protein product [Didymodactylos carnosus]CAF3713349.1 unnamed protein product [Didymodactylos carnosus]CAF3751737.1 unnamed protein product [Didymodactylos carnosus]